MQPDKPLSSQGLDQESSLALDSETPLSPLDNEEASQAKVYANKQRRRSLIRFGLLGLAAFLVVAGIVTLLVHKSPSQASLELGDFPDTHVTLPNLNTIPQNTQPSLQVNGQLEANNSLVLAPTTRPAVPVIGQMYFDKTVKQLLVYNGTVFQPLGSTVTSNQYSTTQLGDTIINNVTEGATAPTVLLQGGMPGTVQTGNFNVSGTGRLGSLAVSGASTMASLDVSGTAMINTATVQNTLTAGNVATSSISAPSNGALAIGTPAAATVTGSIDIHTGDSSTTASGDITLDTGAGIVDGELLETKGFEDGVDGMQTWYSATVSTTTDQAHSGSQSLKITPSSSFWGISTNLNVTTGIAKPTPGHTYYFSMWFRAATVGRNIASAVRMGSTTLSFPTITDSSTGWTQVSGIGVAAADATQFYFTIDTSSGASGEVHYLDDLQITDLSSASAASQISIGATNAKIVTIGNMNEIGATSIYGSSGILLSSGAGSLTANSGVINLNASAASSFTTAHGSLTLTGAATSSWGILQAASGVGGDLTIHAGKGGSDTNNNGGNLILQGGAANGTGIGGSVIVKPATNSTSAFQVQNAAGTTLFVADSSGMQITINGSLTVNGTLTTNGHIATGNDSATTTVVAGSACSTAVASLGSGSNDTAGTVTVTIDTACSSATGTLATITFGSAFATAPRITFTPGNAAAASLQYYRTTSTTGFTLETANSVTAGTTYIFDYQVMQ